MKKIRNIISTLCLLLCSTTIFAQAPTIQWQKCLGGSWNDEAYSVQQTFDGGYIVAGYTMSDDGDVTGYHGFFDYWIVKLNATGTLQWEKCLGGSNPEEAYSIKQTTDSGYIVLGETSSTDGDVSGCHGATDFWVVKLNDTGGIQWQKCFGGSAADIGTSIEQTSDGGYIMAGYTWSTDGEVTGGYGHADYWIVKINNVGALQWAKTYGGSGMDKCNSITQTTDGGYIAAGFTQSNDGDVSGLHGSSDYWVIKLDDTGKLQWQKCLGGSGDDLAFSIQQSTGKNFYVAGTTESNDGNVNGNHGSGTSDYWVVSLDSVGHILWSKCYGGSGYEDERGMTVTPNNTILLAGGTAGSSDGDVSGSYGPWGDYWICVLNDTGKLLWQKCLGGDSTDLAFDIHQTADSGYIVAGYTKSNDGDVTGLHGQNDCWVVKLSGDLSVPSMPNAAKGIAIYPNPTSGILTISSSIPCYEQLSALDGRVLLQTREKFMDIAPFTAGLYLLTVFDENNVKLKTELIEKV